MNSKDFMEEVSQKLSEDYDHIDPKLDNGWYLVSVNEDKYVPVGEYEDFDKMKANGYDFTAVEEASVEDESEIGFRVNFHKLKNDSEESAEEIIDQWEEAF